MTTGAIVGIIPARYASTRLPGKPLVDLLGKPMVQRVYERAVRSNCIQRVIVATDHELVAETVRAFGGEAVMTPPGLPSGTDRIACVAAQHPEAEIVVNIQGDEPLIDPGMIDDAVRPLTADQTVQAGTVVKRITDQADLSNPNVVKAVLDMNGFAIFFSRALIPFARNGIAGNALLADHHYYKHFGCYAFRREFLLEFASWKESPLERVEKLEQLRILEHGYRIKASVTAGESVPVDTPEDAERVRLILRDFQRMEHR